MTSTFYSFVVYYYFSRSRGGVQKTRGFHASSNSCLHANGGGGAEVEVGKKNNCCKKVLKWRRKNISWNHFLGYSWESRKSFGASLEALKGFILARYWALNGSFVCGMLLVTMIIRQRFEASTSRKKRFRSLSVASQSQKAFINATTFGVWRAGGKIESVKV